MVAAVQVKCVWRIDGSIAILKICPKKEISRTLSESRLTALSLIPSNMLVSLKLALGFSAQRPERVPFPSQSKF